MKGITNGSVIQFAIKFEHVIAVKIQLVDVISVDLEPFVELQLSRLQPFVEPVVIRELVVDIVAQRLIFERLVGIIIELDVAVESI